MLRRSEGSGSESSSCNVKPAGQVHASSASASFLRRELYASTIALAPVLRSSWASIQSGATPCRVGGGDQGVWPTPGVQPFAGGLHPHAHGVPGSFRSVHKVRR